MLWTIHFMKKKNSAPLCWVTQNAFRSLVTLLGVVHVGVASAALEAMKLYPYAIDSVKCHEHAFDLNVGSARSQLLRASEILSVVLFVVGFPGAVTIYLL
eukprot:gb/GECG01012445.1/.p1 GENE.gb/GECG01012445.1/~~gb/GECG01012445.1/.p1  ORF type:complete len:100 (+),score=5.43 gb/GECG01012445.1/:1-300(+)